MSSIKQMQIDEPNDANDNSDNSDAKFALSARYDSQYILFNFSCFT